MPELPEVQTIVNSLKKKILGLTIRDIWFDWPKSIKSHRDKNQFKKSLKARKIIGISRKGKNILIELSSKYVLLIHLKLTGHLLYGKWKLRAKNWIPLSGNKELNDPDNKYIHFMIIFSNGTMLALSDLRKFAKIMFFPLREIDEIEDLKKLGPDPMNQKFTFNSFKDIMDGVIKKRHKLKIKQLLLDQNIISGIGNIYSDEILYRSKIHPQRTISRLTLVNLKNIYKAIRLILREAIRSKGSTVGYGDYRDPEGKSGGYSKLIQVYGRENKKCFTCKALIKRIKFGSRSSYFCPKCQKL